MARPDGEEEARRRRRRAGAGAAAARDHEERPTRPDSALRQRALLYGIAGAGIVALIVGRPRRRARRRRQCGGCEEGRRGYDGARLQLQDRRRPSCRRAAGTHVRSLTKKFPWNTTPPSNGQHYPPWAVWGFYTEPVNPRIRSSTTRSTAASSSGGGPKVPQSTVDKLRRSTRRAGRRARDAVPEARQQGRDHRLDRRPAKYGRERLLRPGPHRHLPALHDRTEKAFEAFRDAYRGHGAGGRPARRPTSRAWARAEPDAVLARSPAGVAELVRRSRLKTGGPTGVGVRVPPPASRSRVPRSAACPR